MRTGSNYIDLNAPVGDEQMRVIREMDNNSLIIRLHFTVHHLSRWISPVHDHKKLERSLYRGEPSVKELLIGMRDYEQIVYPRMHVIATRNSPDLDELPEFERSLGRQQADTEYPTIVLLSNFRRLRQSTCSLLRAIPDEAWNLQGRSRRERNVTIRELAENLAEHDYRYLRAMDQTLTDVGARDGIAEIQKASLDELLKLVPTTLKI